MSEARQRAARAPTAERVTEPSGGASTSAEAVLEERSVRSTASGDADNLGILHGLLHDADPELVELYRRAQWLGGRGREPLVSFTSLFLAFLGGGTPLAEWTKATADEMGVLPEMILDRWRASRTYPSQITLENIVRPTAPPGLKNDVTPSATLILTRATTIKEQLGVAALGARHVLGAWLLTPGHDQDRDAWKLRRRSWLARFAVFVGREFPEEAGSWRTLCVQDNDSRVISLRLVSALNAAVAISTARGENEPDPDDLVRALLLCAARWSGQPVANVWLLQQLALDTLEKLKVPSQLTGYDERSQAYWAHIAPLADWLDTARLYALACPRNELNMRHLVAALVSPRGPASGKRMLRAVGGEPTKIANALVELIRRHELDEDCDTWRWILKNDTPRREIRKPGYANDIARGADLLSIETDVHALAAVLASADTKPPLSVGLFGNWGSGKSFFMGMLRDHIRCLAEQSSGKRTAYCAEIAQIEFNAWHYMDGELWASLVCHVLDSLERYFRGDEKSLAEQSKQELATTQLRRADLDKRQRELDDRQHKIDDEIAAYSPTVAELVKTASTEIDTTLPDKAVEAHPKVRGAITDVASKLGVEPGQLDLSVVRNNVSAMRVWWRQLDTRRIVAGAAVMAIAAAVAVISAWSDQWLVTAIAALAPVIGIAQRILEIGRPIARSARKALEIGNRLAKQVAVNRPEVVEKQKQLQAEQQDVSSEQATLENRANELRKLLDASAKPGMREYVLQRSASADYRERLGIIASVHRDFQNLSDQLRDDTSQPKLQRIILYIDDLDRCPPERVVEVLQALHLLLSFELFVAVVAVDPNWLLRSLEAYYARQFPKEGNLQKADWESRPQFYLEKIFQIPYALRPMSAGRFDAMVDGLLKRAVVGTTPSAQPAVETQSSPSVPPTDVGSPPTTAAVPPIAARPVRRLDLTPRNLEITQAELDHIRTLGPLVSSPRAAKRLVNLYRIIRAGLDGDALEEFIDDRYQLTQIVLAAVVGCPNIAAEWFKGVFPRDSGDVAALIVPLEKLSKIDSRAKFLYDRVGGSRETGNWDHVIAVCASAARYSFETGPLLELLPPMAAATIQL